MLMGVTELEEKEAIIGDRKTEVMLGSDTIKQFRKMLETLVHYSARDDVYLYWLQYKYN
jgi:hypothetical protein